MKLPILLSAIIFSFSLTPLSVQAYGNEFFNENSLGLANDDDEIIAHLAHSFEGTFDRLYWSKHSPHPAHKVSNNSQYRSQLQNMVAELMLLTINRGVDEATALFHQALLEGSEAHKYVYGEKHNVFADIQLKLKFRDTLAYSIDHFFVPIDRTKKQIANEQDLTRAALMAGSAILLVNPFIFYGEEEAYEKPVSPEVSRSEINYWLLTIKASVQIL